MTSADNPDFKPSAKVSRFHQTRTYLAGQGLGPFLLRSIIGSGAIRLASMAIAFLAGALLARTLGVAPYGYYSVALGAITIAGIPAELGLPLLLTREISAAAAREDYGKVHALLAWANRVCLKIAVSVGAAVALAGLAVLRMGPAELAAALLAGVPVVPLIALARVRSAGLQGLNHVVRSQIPWMLLRPAALALLLGLAYLLKARVGAGSAMAFNTISALLVLLVASWWLKHRLPSYQVAEAVSPERHWLASSIRLGLMDGLRGLQSELSIVLVGLVAGATTVGLLRIATITAATSAAAILIVVTVGLPVLARQFALGEQVRLQRTVSALTIAQFAGVAVLAAPLILFPAVLIKLGFGDSFVPAANALRIITVAYVVTAALGPNGPLLVAANHERRVARAMAAGLILNIITVPLFTYYWDLLGASLALALSLVSWNVLCWREAHQLLGIDTSILHWPVRSGPQQD